MRKIHFYRSFYLISCDEDEERGEEFEVGESGAIWEEDKWAVEERDGEVGELG